MDFSVIIPTCNRADVLQRTLSSLAQASWRDQCEVIVVDNGSSDHTREVFETVRNESIRKNWRYIHEPMPGLLSGRHRGAMEAAGDILAYLDDDVRVGADWLPSLSEAFSRPGVVLAGGPTVPLFLSSPPDWLRDFYEEDNEGRMCTWLSLFDGGAEIKPVYPTYIFGLNFSIRKDVLFKLGGFHPDCVPKALQRFQGDGETGLSWKIAENPAYGALYHPGAKLEHEIGPNRLTLEYFKQRAFYQGVSDSYTRIRKNGGLASPSGGAIRRALQSVKRSLKNSLAPGKPAATDLKAHVKEFYRAGYGFHQREVMRDPVLLDWTLKPSYLEYGLPDGWETFLKNA